MTVLVTGSTGLVGNHVVRRLLNEGQAVRVLIRQQSDPRPLEGLPVEICCGDVRDAESVRAACRGVAAVIHAAAMIHLGWTKLEAAREINVSGTRNVAQATRDAGARLWGNVETAEYVCPSIEEYVRLYGRVHHSAAKGLPWRPVPIGRLKEKLLLAAEFSERIVTWGYREFCRAVLGPSAERWHEDYRQYVREVER